MSCNKSCFMGGLFVGTIIGGALGILLAPSSGEETRRKLKDGVQDTVGEMYDQVVEYGENLKEQLQDMIDSATDRVNQYKNKQETQDEANQGIKGLSEKLEVFQKKDGEAVSDAAKNTVDADKDAVGDAKEIIANAADKALDTIDSVKNAVKNVMKD